MFAEEHFISIFQTYANGCQKGKKKSVFFFVESISPICSSFREAINISSDFWLIDILLFFLKLIEICEVNNSNVGVIL